MAYKPVFHAYSAILDSFFYAYGTIVDTLTVTATAMGKYSASQSPLEAL